MADPFGGLGLEIDDEEERRRQLAALSGLDEQPESDASGLPATPAQPSGQMATPGALANVSAPGAAPAVPPPPPPPPPSAFETLTPGLGQFAQEWLIDPNRYLSDMATAQRKVSEGRLQQAEEAGRVKNDEFYASRGLTGSSYEGEGRKRLDEALQRTRGEDEARILEMLATAETADRQAAGEFGLEAIRAGDVMGLERYRAGLEGGQLGEAQRQFDTSIGQRESEFARNHGLDEREFEAEQQRFSQQFGEQVAGRLQQNEQFRVALESENARYGLDVGLRQKALALQEQGMNMEDAFNRAALDQERELTQSAQDLQRYGIDQDSAYKYAALLQDKTFQTEAQRLQALGMDLDEAFRRAELTFRSTQADRDEAFRQAEAEREQERFEMMMEIALGKKGSGTGDEEKTGGTGTGQTWG